MKYAEYLLNRHVKEKFEYSDKGCLGADDDLRRKQPKMSLIYLTHACLIVYVPVAQTTTSNCNTTPLIIEDLRITNVS